MYFLVLILFTQYHCEGDRVASVISFFPLILQAQHGHNYPWDATSKINQKCYNNPYLERFSSKSVDWYKAKDFCQNQKARLVEIKSKEENEAIADALRENGFSTKKIHFWIGVRDIGNGIHWRVKDQWRLDSNMRKARF